MNHCSGEISGESKNGDKGKRWIWTNFKFSLLAEYKIPTTMIFNPISSDIFKPSWIEKKMKKKNRSEIKSKFNLNEF